MDYKFLQGNIKRKSFLNKTYRRKGSQEHTEYGIEI